MFETHKKTQEFEIDRNVDWPYDPEELIEEIKKPGTTNLAGVLSCGDVRA